MGFTDFNRRRAVAGAFAALLTPLNVWAQTKPKEVLAFYYGWYGTQSRSGSDIHWKDIDADRKTIGNCPDYPVGGAYDSLDPEVIKRQVGQAKDAGITGFIASWWGQKDRTDQQFPLLLDAADGLRIAPYIEQAQSPEALAADILYLHQSYGKHEACLKLDGRPVIFLFDRVMQTIGVDGWKKARDLVEDKAPKALAFVGPANNAKEISERKPVFDALHIYSMQFAVAHPHFINALWRADFYKAWVNLQSGLKVRTATVLPGFDDHLLPDRTGKRPIVNRNNGGTLQNLLKAAINAKPDWLLIVSFNEWHEGSQIEPSEQFIDVDLTTVRTLSATFNSR